MTSTFPGISHTNTITYFTISTTQNVQEYFPKSFIVVSNVTISVVDELLTVLLLRSITNYNITKNPRALKKLQIIIIEIRNEPLLTVDKIHKGIFIYSFVREELPATICSFVLNLLKIIIKTTRYAYIIIIIKNIVNIYDFPIPRGVSNRRFT